MDNDLLISKGLENLIAVLEQEHKKLKEMQEQLSTNLAQLGTDCISRQAAIDALRTCYDTETITMDNGDEYINYGDAVGEIEQLPSAQPKKGKWERHYSRTNVYADLFWHCSECGYKNSENYAPAYHHYCPNCGADMR